MAACGDDDDEATPTATATVEPTSQPTATATPSPEPTETQSFDLSPNFNAENAFEHARVLAEDIGPRAAGTAQELAAAEYIRDELASYGYEADLQTFPVETYQDFGSELAVSYSGGSLSIIKLAFFDSISGAVEGDVVYAGLGYAEDFPASTAGGIALMERGVLTFTQKVTNAKAAGAVGALIFNDEAGYFRGQLEDPSSIPTATLSREDGLALVDLIADGPVTGSYSVDFRFADSEESHNVVARTEGGECRFVLGGHLDSVPAGPGANDNASGTAVVIEIARALAAREETDGVCFTLFGAEEIGLLGSAYYVDALAASELDGIEAMLNFDMLAVGEGWPFAGSNHLVNLVGEVAEGLDIPYRISSGGRLGSDHASFLDAGVPAIMFNCFCDPNYHTSADQARFLLEDRLAQAGALGLGLLDMLRAA